MTTTDESAWLAGDWEFLSNLRGTNSRQRHWRIVALAQLSRFDDLARAIKEEQQDLESNSWTYRALFSSLCNTLARAKMLSGEVDSAREYFQQSLMFFVLEGRLSPSAVTFREIGQRSQLDLPPIPSQERILADGSLMSPALEILKWADRAYPLQEEILIALAEAYQGAGQFQEAIQYWQTLASTLQEDMPQAYYDRLDEAYRSVSLFPRAAEEFERVRGEMPKHQLLRQIHEILKPSKYLEIGVESGASLVLAKGEAIGVDPMPRPGSRLRSNHRIVRKTSDRFFEEDASLLVPPPDLVFIDGMHLFEFALRDFINVERLSGKKTVVLMDDVFPGHALQAERDRQTPFWTGDVWKVHLALSVYRPDLKITLLDVHPTGLIVIEGLDRQNTSLIDSYDEIVERFIGNSIEDHRYIEREGSVSPLAWLEAYAVHHRRESVPED